MHRLLLAVFLSAFAWSNAHASPCLVGPWRFTFGEHTSATITAPAGAVCGMYIGSLSPGAVVQRVSISSPPRNGTAVAYGMGVSYQAKPDFTGQDSFTFAIAGRGNSGPGTGIVKVNVTVTPAASGALVKPIRVPESGPISLLEYAPLLTENRGPEKAVGAFYFIRGLVSGDRDDDRHRPPQYFLTSLSQAGWDVTYAKYPQDLIYPGQATHGRVAEFVRHRLRQLQRQGYRRVIVGGQSWGAWVTLVAEQQGDLPANGLFLLVPATHGKKTTLLGKPNPSYTKNRSEFAPLVTSIRKPVAAIFFADDDYDPGGRGKLVEQHVRNRQLAHLLIDNPAGFKGHGAGWLPMFDYAYGKCIQAFLETLSTQRCEPPALSNDDFRAILHRDQVSQLDAIRIRTPEELIGRTYVVYTPSSATTEVTYGPARSLQRQSARGRVDEQYEFRDGQHCQDGKCQLLIQWDRKHVVGFHPSTGATMSWWIEQ